MKNQCAAICVWLGLLMPALALTPKSALPDLSSLPPRAEGTVDFAKDIQPILSSRCYECHGPEKHKGGLRLDYREEALAGGDSGKVIMAGKSAESLLIHNVAGLNPDKVMPPKGKPLTKEEIGKLRAWIDDGAVWPAEASASKAVKSDHWAFQPVQPVPLPAVKNKSWARTPIDAFVLARLEREKIKPAPEADRPTLIRRLSLDLLGLIPTPEEVQAFVKDARPDAYERLVDRLLASPHFGERWGRHWLDLARYADSDGYEKDLPRPYAYLFRDWVIDAINRDLPFDQFTIEQLAGDLLPNATHEQKLATAFHRQTLTNREGGVDKEEFRCKATVDRVSTTGTVWLGLTVACAECHTHKFDPISQREFYQLYAFFNNASEKDIPAPQPSELETYQKQLAEWEAKLAKLEAPLNDYLKNDLDENLAAWIKDLKLPAARWTLLTPKKVAVATEGDETLFNAQPDKSILSRERDPVRSRFRVETDVPLKNITGFRLEVIADAGKPVGRAKNGNFGLSEFVVTAELPDGKSVPVKLARAVADYSAKEDDIANAIDNDRTTRWSIGTQTNQSHVAIFETAEPLDFPKGTKLSFRLEQYEIGLIARFRLAATTTPGPLEPDLTPDAIVEILDTPTEKRTAKQKATLSRHFAEQVDPMGMKLNQSVIAHKAKKPKFPDTLASVMVADERKTQIHIRGDFLRKGDEVQPATLKVLHPFKPRSPVPDRLDLAHWIVDPANPLVGRVTVNHVWQNLFGRALVTTVNDFGTRGDKPSHPELLDWLATKFTTPAGKATAVNDPVPGLGWSRKALIKLIVTSATYRQSSAVRPELAQRDPNNILLARQNRFRLEAETVRDVYLTASGLLNPAVGGPSVRPPLPADIAALGYANQVKWAESKGVEKYRRGMYIFFQRTVPYPMLMTFDAPDSNVSCTRRERSNTPLQALTLLNDPVFFECAQALGKRVDAAAAASDEKIKKAFQYALGRDPSKAELERLLRLYDDQKRLLSQQADLAPLIAGEPKESAVDLKDRAAVVAISRVILNLDEFVTRD